MTDKQIQDIMTIILSSGEARKHCENALEFAKQKDVDNVNAELSHANEEITKAHVLHTQFIQTEASGEKIEYSILLAHAQDTMMVVDSEIRMSKKIIDVWLHI